MLGYSETIEQIINEFPYGAPIKTDDIAMSLSQQSSIPFAQAKTLINIKLKRMADKGIISRLQRGTYFKNKRNIVGQLSREMDKYLVDSLMMDECDIIGYISGKSLLFEFGFEQSLVVNREFTTNDYRRKLPENFNITLKKPSITVNKSNYLYLQCLDCICNLDKYEYDVKDTFDKLSKFISLNKLDPMRLIRYGRLNFSNRTLLYLIDVLVEIHQSRG